MYGNAGSALWKCFAAATRHHAEKIKRANVCMFDHVIEQFLIFVNILCSNTLWYLRWYNRSTYMQYTRSVFLTRKPSLLDVLCVKTSNTCVTNLWNENQRRTTWLIFFNFSISLAVVTPFAKYVCFVSTFVYVYFLRSAWRDSRERGKSVAYALHLLCCCAVFASFTCSCKCVKQIKSNAIRNYEFSSNSHVHFFYIKKMCYIGTGTYIYFLSYSIQYMYWIYIHIKYYIASFRN